MHRALAAYARWRHRLSLSIDWREQQAKALNRCIALNYNTQFIRDHQLMRGMTIREYQSRVPIWNYLDFHHAYVEKAYPTFGGVLTAKPVKYVAASSGTTGGINKYYPFPSETLRGFKRTAAAQVLATVAHLGNVRPFFKQFLSIADMSPLRDLGEGVRAGLVTDVISICTVDCQAFIGKCIGCSWYGGSNPRC